MTDDSTSNPTRPKTRAPLLPPPASISYRMIGRLLRLTARTQSKLTQLGNSTVETEDNVNAHSGRYWHRVGELFPSISAVFLSWLRPIPTPLHSSHLPSHGNGTNICLLPSPSSRSCPILVTSHLHLPSLILVHALLRCYSWGRFIL